jgi:hypothetical protein
MPNMPLGRLAADVHKKAKARSRALQENHMRCGIAMALAILAGLGSASLSAHEPEMPHHGWGSRTGTYAYVPDAAGQPSRRYITTQGGHHMHLPRRPKPPCQVPTSICIKPKVWKFSQVFYQLHHELWHGVTDPCWLMDPDCCGNSCQHQKSFGLLHLVPRRGDPRGQQGGVNGCQYCEPIGCQGACQRSADCEGENGVPCNECDGEVEGEVIEGGEIVPTPAEPPVQHPEAARRGPLRSILLRRE